MPGTTKSDELFQRAQRVIPGGVNSPVRAFRAVGRTPLFITTAAGSTIADADGNVYTDYVGSWGPMIAGHAHPQVVQAVQLQAIASTSFGAPSTLEVTMAQQLNRAGHRVTVLEREEYIVPEEEEE